MPAGYSGTPLAKKLGLKAGQKVHLVNAPSYYFDLFDEVPEMEIITDLGETVDFIHLFSKQEKELKASFPRLKERLAMNGLIWVSWPKKAAKVATDVTEAIVRKTGLDNGLVDVKICAVDPTWSGLKFVYRTKDRS